jgi:hypothetical protein
MTTAIMACMRNEAMFITEWVAYHRLIGFDKVFVCSNGCTDGTDLILDRLEALGQVIHVRNDEMFGLAPQPAGVKKVLNHPQIADVEWLLHIDADEFLNIHHGDGHIRNLVAVGQNADAIAMTWRLFGDSGMTDWKGGLLLEQQVLAEDKQSSFGAMQKTMFRPDRFRAGIDHMPKQPVSGDIRLCNARGRNLNPAAIHDPASSDLRLAQGQEVNRKRHFGWDGAQVNHYAVRTPDLFLMKNVRGDGVGSRFTKRYFLNSRWYRAANRNEVEDRSILRHLKRLKAALVELRKDKALKLLESMALKRFAQMKAEHLTPANIAAWTNGEAD